jgi:4'-phosphopantetheinyl transferase EntD
MIQALLPRAAASAWFPGTDPSARLLPAETAQLGWAVEKRVREHATGRSCARRALAALGVPPVPLLAGHRRAPRWPAGVVGSITHCPGYCAAAVARRADLSSLGIDAEVHAPLPDGVTELVSLDAERAWLAQAPSGIHWDRILFSAKESVFKAWFPLTGLWLDFCDAEISFEPATGSFQATLRPGLRAAAAGREITAFAGWFAVRAGLVLTAITVAA